MKRKTWQDLYYDGEIDIKYQGFDEDMQEIVELHKDDEWVEYESEEDYWREQDEIHKEVSFNNWLSNHQG